MAIIWPCHADAHGVQQPPRSDPQRRAAPSGSALATGVQNAADSGLFSEDERSPAISPLALSRAAPSPMRSPFDNSNGLLPACSGASSDDDGGEGQSSPLERRDRFSNQQRRHAGGSGSAGAQSPAENGRGHYDSSPSSPSRAAGDRLTRPSAESLLSPHQRHRRLQQQKSLELRDRQQQQLGSPRYGSPLKQSQDGAPTGGSPLGRSPTMPTSPQPHPRLQPRRSFTIDRAHSRPAPADALST